MNLNNKANFELHTVSIEDLINAISLDLKTLENENEIYQQLCIQIIKQYNSVKLLRDKNSHLGNPPYIYCICIQNNLEIKKFSNLLSFAQIIDDNFNEQIGINPAMSLSHANTPNNKTTLLSIQFF